ncbi:MAG TPA: DUF5689 domain-containing protein [Tenuifilaceae bacterium]|nr:DUF5689 domain-containing protein [Tenuifilaceae bacterium]
MNSVKKIAGWFFPLLLSATFTGCNDELDSPPVPVLDEQSIVTIANLRAQFPPSVSHTFVGDSSLFAVVTMDESTGNIYKNLYVQDNTGGVLLRLKATSRLREGDLLRISLKGSTLQYFEKLLQIDGVDAVTSLFTQARGIKIDPQTVTIPDLYAADFPTRLQSVLIKLENVQFIATDTAKTYADPVNQISENRTLEDEHGNTVLVRTNGFANFAGEKVPNGNGSIIAIASQYGNDRQLIIRHLYEVKLNGTRF